MENKDDDNFFDFLPQNSVITYKKFQFNYKELKISKVSFKKGKYLYDIYTNQFLYFVNGNICVFNIKGHLERRIKYTRNEKIIYCTCEKANRYLLLVAEKNKVLIIDYKNEVFEEYNSLDYKTGAKFGFILGVFFYS